MLTKFISVLETRFQNIKIALKNQQASIQGLETQIGQLAKLISKRPLGSLPSNTEPNPMEKINAITIQDEEGLETGSKNIYEPCSSNIKGPIYKEWRLQIKELDEWQTQKLRTADKLKSSQDELNTSPNQLKVGDKVLLDTTDPHIATSESNEEIPLTILNIFPYGTFEVIPPKFGTFKVNNTHLKPYIDKFDSRDEECKLLEPP
ncbi:hypothetical protein GOBAR_AA06710 [Gossypium barbadense]|uniref:Uncharacterized protein n=1 Tax=Gossypium barbadense TaxID=3634 RepID=A0A2P5YE41_GOSBA|nr:hypothetical protein GOBAR_AA06710 [Gossypium barbadense]